MQPEQGHGLGELRPVVALATLDFDELADEGPGAAVEVDRAAAEGWTSRRVKVDGIFVGARMAQAAAPHGIEVQVSTRDRDVKGFKPLPPRWRIEGTFGTLTNRYHRLTRNLEQSARAAEDAVTIANCHSLIRAFNS